MAGVRRECGGSEAGVGVARVWRECGGCGESEMGVRLECGGSEAGVWRE